MTTDSKQTQPETAEARQAEATQTAQASLPAVHEAWLPREHPLHRPRHGRRQAVALVCAAIFFVTPLLAMVLGVRVSQFENRPLTPFPNPLQGWSFFTQLSPWATDHLPLREQAIHTGDFISRNVFGEPPALGNRGQPSGPIQQNQQNQHPPAGFPPVIEGKAGWLYLGAEVESHCKQSRRLEDTFAALNRLRTGVEASGRKFVVVIAPDKATIVPEYLPDEYIGESCHRAVSDEFWRRVGSQGYIIDLRSELRRLGRQLGAPVYGPVDAHWSDEGGVTMAVTLAERLLPGVTSNWAVTPGAAWQVPADIPPLIGRTGTSDGRYYSIKPDGQRDLTRDVVGNFAVDPVRLTTANGAGTCQFGVALLSDSFTYRAMRYLAASFGDMTVIHHNLAKRDEGVMLGEQAAGKAVVAVEVAERTLVSGELGILGDETLDNFLQKLSEHPIR